MGCLIRPKGQNASQDTSYVTLPSDVMSKSYTEGLSITTIKLSIRRLPLPTKPANLTLDFKLTKSRKYVIFAYSDNLVWTKRAALCAGCREVHSQQIALNSTVIIRFLCRLRAPGGRRSWSDVYC